jgi:transposase
MAKTQVEVITSVQRRRYGTAVDKERLVAASLEPGAVVSALPREAGIHPSQLYGWRRKLCARRGAAQDFTSVRIVGEPVTAGLPAPLGAIEIELAGGTRLRLTGAADAATVAALVTKDRRS